MNYPFSNDFLSNQSQIIKQITFKIYSIKKFQINIQRKILNFVQLKVFGFIVITESKLNFT